MAYLLTLNGTEHKAEVEESRPGEYNISLNGKSYNVDARRTAGSTYSILINNRAYEADLQPGDVGELRFMIRGEVFHIHAIDERRKLLRAAAAREAGGSGEVSTPMPGKVARILTSLGNEVKRGDGVITVEAMKMENEMASPVDGVVKEIHVSEGDTVEGGALLVTIEAKK